MTMTCVRRIRVLCLVAALLTVEVGCGDESKRIPLGITEQQVIEILGRPSNVYPERDAIARFLLDPKECASKVVRVLYYNRHVRQSVSVGIDVEGRVACVRSYFHMDYTVR